MEKEMLRCECGHENPVGTKLCGLCGHALTDEEQEKKLADMRYDGIAIRSKTYNKSIIDKVWNFFSSVKVGIILIILNLVAASIGTILPQEFYVTAYSDAERKAYYSDVYGSFGTLYYNLGLTDVYSSWWFQILVLLLGVSIIIASIDRGVPLHKSLKNQRVKRHVNFMNRQRLIAQGQASDQMLDEAEQQLRSMKYKVRREGNALMAEKNRIARYGPYINHLGLIIFLGTVMLRLIPGMVVDSSIWVAEGETRAVPGMDGYFIYNEDFILETHDGEAQGEQLKQGVNVVAKNYQTNATLYRLKEGALPGQTDDLEEVMKAEIKVNHPLKYDGYAFYQMDYSLGQLSKMKFNLTNKETGDSLGEVTIDLKDPQENYDLGNGNKVELLSYTPDFSGFEDGVPITASQNPNNPLFIFRMYTEETPDGETSMVAIKETSEPLGENKYKMSFVSVDTFDSTGLTIRKDKSVPLLFVGGFIFMLGVVIGSYFAHRRIWIEQLEDGTVHLAAHTNKNWFGIKKDLTMLTEKIHLPQFVDQVELDKENNKDTETKGDKA